MLTCEVEIASARRRFLLISVLLEDHSYRLHQLNQQTTIHHSLSLLRHLDQYRRNSN